MSNIEKESYALFNSISIQRKFYTVTNDPYKIYMKEEYKLPEKWFIPTKDLDDDTINHYRINIAEYSTSDFHFEDYNAMYYDGSGGDCSAALNDKFIQISADDFNQYVLGIKPESVNTKPQDYTYLIEFLTTIK